MDPITSSALIGAGTSLAGSGVQTAIGLLGRKKQWEREDNAVQRRAADLEAAGLSKTLAAGSAAQSQTPSINTGSGFSDAGKALQQIPLAKAQKASLDAQADKMEQEAKALQWQNIEAAEKWRWLETGAEDAPVWGPNDRNAGMPMWNNREQQRRIWQAEQDSATNTMGFYNQYGLPNQPGVLQSQTGQILMLNRAWSMMTRQERKEFLIAYGATTLSDVAKNLLGAASGAIGSNLKSPTRVIHSKGAN